MPLDTSSFPNLLASLLGKGPVNPPAPQLGIDITKIDPQIMQMALGLNTGDIGNFAQIASNVANISKRVGLDKLLMTEWAKNFNSIPTTVLPDSVSISKHLPSSVEKTANKYVVFDISKPNGYEGVFKSKKEARDFIKKHSNNKNLDYDTLQNAEKEHSSYNESPAYQIQQLIYHLLPISKAND